MTGAKGSRRLVDEGILRSGDQEIPYRALRSPRARRYRIVLREPWNPVELVIPAGGSLSEAVAFLRSKAGWIGSHRDRVDDRGLRPEPLRLRQGSVLVVAGEVLRVHVRRERRRRPRVEAWDGELQVRLPTDGDADVQAPILRWLRRSAREEIRQRVEHWSPRIQVQPRRISLRDPRSRWGSCSSSGTLSFSWRLVLAPPEVLDAIVIHELVHLRIMDHSPRFYELLHRYCPDYPQRRAWLERNADRLRRVGA